jgi:hypothetical protein
VKTNQRIQHDAAIAIAKACLDVVASCIHPSCHKDAWEEFYQVAKAGIEGYEIQNQRMLQRLLPCKN